MSGGALSQKCFVSIFESGATIRVAEERARFLEGQQMLVEGFDHRVGVFSCDLIDAREILDILVAEFEEILAPQAGLDRPRNNS
jgi:hypothetical protein